MRQALTKLLYRRYPALYAEHVLPATESGMAWGFQHEDGWFAIMDILSGILSGQEAPLRVTGVKQKFGVLRVSIGLPDDFARGAMAVASAFSQMRCERSGRRGILMVRGRRTIQTLAPDADPDFSPVAPLTELHLPPPTGGGVWGMAALAQRHVAFPLLAKASVSPAYRDLLDACLSCVSPETEHRPLLAICRIADEPSGGIVVDQKPGLPVPFADGAIAFCVAMARRLDRGTGACGPVNDLGELAGQA